MKKLLLSAILLASPSLVLADVTDGDWRIQGDSDVFVDTSNQRIFLDLDITQGSTIQQILDRLDTDLNGWRLPTLREMADFYASMTGYDPYGESSVLLTIQDSRHLQSITGTTGRNSTNYGYQYFSKGLYLGDDGNTYAFELNSASDDDNYVAYHYWRGQGIDASRNDAGIWLTPDENNLTLFQQNNVEYNTISDVYTPGAISALSLLALGMTRRQRKRMTAAR